MTDISVIIVSYKGAERLAACLGSLVLPPEGRMTREVIIADNCSEDEGIDLLEKKYTQFRFLHNSVNGGFANGCNLGASHASGEFLLFLNPDTVMVPGAMESMVFEARRHPGFTICSCRQVKQNGSESVAWGAFPGFWNITGLQRSLGRLLRGQEKVNGDRANPEIWFPDWVSGSVILIRRKDFVAAGGFDNDYWMYYEDVDLCKRISIKGGKVAFFRSITIEHNHGGSSRINIRTASKTKCEVMISRHIYISKHKRGIEKAVTQIFMVLNNVVTGLIPAVAGVIFPFIPKVGLRAAVYLKLVRYYFNASFKATWVSPNSVNYIRQKVKRKKVE
ncbi:MAG TPA: glycosyltransferase family 2 protein [Bacteroidales bacterium]|nr:glycosyltransferase family 2 protein [Bacteroidales bacterium]